MLLLKRKFCGLPERYPSQIHLRHEESPSHIMSSLDMSYGKHWDEINNKCTLQLSQSFKNQSTQNHTSYTLEVNRATSLMIFHLCYLLFYWTEEASKPPHTVHAQTRRLLWHSQFVRIPSYKRKWKPSPFHIITVQCPGAREESKLQDPASTLSPETTWVWEQHSSQNQLQQSDATSGWFPLEKHPHRSPAEEVGR